MKISAVLLVPSIILLRQGFKTAAYEIKQPGDLKRNKANIDGVYLSLGLSGTRLGLQIRF